MLGGLLLAAAGAQLVLAATADVVVATAMLTVSSFAFGIFNVVTATTFQSLTPPGLLGRVSSAHRMAIMGASPVGALLGGAVSTWLGLRAPFILGVPLLLVGVVIGVTQLRYRLPGGPADGER